MSVFTIVGLAPSPQPEAVVPALEYHGMRPPGVGKVYGIPGVIQLYCFIVSFVRRQSIWHRLSLFLRDTFLPVLSPV